MDALDSGRALGNSRNSSYLFRAIGLLEMYCPSSLAGVLAGGITTASCKISIAGIEYLDNRVRGVHPPERSGEVNFLQIEIEYWGQ